MASEDHAGGDPAARVAQFHRARATDPRARLADFLPPSGSRDRMPVLIELIKIDLELQAQTGQPTRLEPYLHEFADDLPAAVPVALLYQEYRVRHLFADAPAVGEYQARFSDRFEAFRRYVAENPVETPRAGTALPSIGGGRPPDDTRTADDPVPAAPTRPALSPPPPARSAAESDPSDREYRKLRVLGKGAYGKVFLGQAPGGVPVAIKEILRSMDHPIGKSERASLETMKQLSHPFLIQIHNFWVEAEQLNIVMELAEGSLSDWMDEWKEKGQPGPPVEELIPFFAQAAEALDYLHSQKVSHRDVKPQNLLRLRGYAKVADFGLARTHSHSVTTVPHELGTPLYMAPEVWKKRVSYQSDQYSLAATYAHARLGRPPIEAGDFVELMQKHVGGDADLGDLPADEQRVLRKALAVKPEDRYSTCKEFVDALRTAVLLPPVPSPAWPRRTLVAGGVALGCGLAYLLYLAFAPTPPVQETNQSVVQEAKPPVPPGWAAAAGAETEADRSGKRYYQAIERSVGGATLTAVLVPQTGVDDPPSFYLMQEKVSNEVMAAAWAGAEADAGSALRRFRGEWEAVWRASGKEPLPGRWKEGADTPYGKRLGVTGDQLDLPAVKLTAVEAALAADYLGGRLPDLSEWKAAVGDRPADRPFDPKQWALGLDRPAKVNRPTEDVSPRGIRQLLSNGQEWTRTTLRPSEPINPLGGRPTLNDVRVVGRSWELPAKKPPTLADTEARPWEWFYTDAQIGFRVTIPVP